MKYPNKDYIEHLRRKYPPGTRLNSAVWKMNSPCRPVPWGRWNVSTTLGKSM